MHVLILFFKYCWAYISLLVFIFLLKVSFTDDLRYINDTISSGRTPSENENQSLKDLIDMQYQFNSMAKNSSLSKIFDYNKEKDLKNIKDFKLKHLDDIFENDFNDLDENLFQLKSTLDIAQQKRQQQQTPVLMEEKIYDNKHKESNFIETSLEEGSHI